MKRQRRCRLLALSILCISSQLAIAQDQPRAEAAHPALAELEARLKPVVLKAQPEAVVKVEGYRLTIRYRLNKFPVTALQQATQNQAAQADVPAAPARPTLTGPEPEGILVELSIRRDSSLASGLTTPADTQHLFWTTHSNRYNLAVLPVAETQATTEAKPPVAAPGTERAEYVDQQRQKWAYDALNALSRASVLEGYEEGTWRGYRNMTRYEFAVAIARLVHNANWRARGFDLGEIVMPGPQPQVYQVPEELTAQTIGDIVAALTREFQYELSRLGVRVDMERRVTSLGEKPKEAPTTVSPKADGKKYEYLWMSLSYGAKADPGLVEQIKQTVASYATEKAK